MDAGTIEMVRAAGPEVVSSADLVQVFEARWTPEQKAPPRPGRARLPRREGRGLRPRSASGSPPGARVTESEVQALIGAALRREQGLYTDHPCIVAVNDHASDPHFETAAGPNDREIKKGDLVLIDFWAKVANDPRAVYYDATWMAYCGPEVPARMREVWETVKGARDAAIEFVTGVDRGGRDHPRRRGGRRLARLTSRSAATASTSSTAPATRSATRSTATASTSTTWRPATSARSIPGVCFSIEPGVYLPEFGVRSEIDMFVGEGRAEVTGDIQRELLLLA